jgi:hypothetical protein
MIRYTILLTKEITLTVITSGAYTVQQLSASREILVATKFEDDSEVAKIPTRQIIKKDTYLNK